MHRHASGERPDLPPTGRTIKLAVLRHRDL